MSPSSPVVTTSHSEPPVSAPESSTQPTPITPLVGDRYEAIYPFPGEAQGDLSFKEGDIILVTKKGGNWWTGVLDGREGLFPFNYVQEIAPREEIDSPHTRDTLEPTETGAAPVQSVPNRSHSSSSTASSNSAADVSRQMLDPPGAAASISVLTQPLVARVKVAFQAEQDTQLSLAPGELIKVVKQASNGWWVGELQSRGKQRRAGWFPANRVELLASKSGTPNPSVSVQQSLDEGRICLGHLNFLVLWDP